MSDLVFQKIATGNKNADKSPPIWGTKCHGALHLADDANSVLLCPSLAFTEFGQISKKCYLNTAGTLSQTLFTQKKFLMLRIDPSFSEETLFHGTVPVPTLLSRYLLVRVCMNAHAALQSPLLIVTSSVPKEKHARDEQFVFPLR